MEKTSKSRVQMLTDVRRATEKGKYDLAGRHAGEFISKSYFLELQEDLFLGEVLESIYEQLSGEMDMHEKISEEDMIALNQQMVRNLDKLINACTGHGGSVYEALINLRYDATTIQRIIDVKYNYKPDALPSGSL